MRSRRIARMGHRGRRRRRSSSDAWWKRQYGGMPTWGLIAAAGAIVAISLVAIPAALQLQRPAEASGPRPVPTFTFESRGEPSATPRPTVAFLGDSYSPAQDLPLQDYNFGVIAAKSLGWGEVLPFGRGGTGFTNPGQAEENDDVYATRVPAIIEAKPNIVVIQGGTNDREYDATRQAADELLRDLRDGLPEAQLLVVGPLTTPVLDLDTMAPVRDALRDAASAQDVPFIDPIEENWLELDDSRFVDGVHPTGEAQQVLADLFTDAARDALG